MKLKVNKTGHAILAGVLMVAAGGAWAEDRWYVDFTGALTNLSTSSVDVSLDTGFTGPARLDADNGFGGGGAFGREIGENWRVEAEVMYRTNDVSSVDLGGQRIAEGGDYSSLMIAANGFYVFGDEDRGWRPFVGAGLGLLQEIDIDFVSQGQESSYSGDDVAWQVMAGVEWRFSDAWSVDFEARYIGASGIDMDYEEGSVGGSVNADYEVFTLGAGLTWRF